MNKSNTLYWKTATDPAERIEVRLVLNSYIDNDNLYVGLESRSKDNSECWESYTDITVNLNSLPPFHAYVDNRDCNRHVHDFLTSNRIAEPAGFEYQGFRMFRFNPDRLKELAPEQFKTISAKLPPQDDMIKDIIYQERRFPLRTVQDIHGIYLVSSKELEESLIGDIVFLRRPYKGYRAVELMERLECRWLVRIVGSGLELEVYEDELISEF